MTDVQVREPEASGTKRAITLVDGDVHSTMMPGSLHARLSSRWQRHLEEFGPRVAGRLRDVPADAQRRLPRRRAPRARASRAPISGSCSEQLLDEYDMDYAVLTPMQAQNFGQEAPELAAEMCRALNDWTREEWLDREPRLLGSICPPHEHPDLAVAEIERLAGDDRFVQVLLPGTLEQGLGNRRYWPILRAAAEAGLPVALHTGGNEMHRGAGWPSYYLEMHVWNGNTMAMQMLSMICSGVFEEIPGSADGLRRDRHRVGRRAVLVDGRRVARRSARATRPACSEPPSRVPARALVVHDAADRGARRPGAPRARVRRARHGRPDHVLQRLPALGLRRARRRRCPRSISREDKEKIFAGNACRLYGLPRR